MINFYARKADYIYAIRRAPLYDSDKDYLVKLVLNARPEDEEYVQIRCLEYGVNIPHWTED